MTSEVGPSLSRDGLVLQPQPIDLWIFIGFTMVKGHGGRKHAQCVVRQRFGIARTILLLILMSAT